jgi:FtsP/CotA-like multicopper oxidase with cupredoxin domain
MRLTIVPGTLNATNANPYTEAPATGVVRSYDWTVSRMNLAPDGVEKSMLVVNGQFPGPTIEANWGDWIEGKHPMELNDHIANQNIVTVKNELEDEGTSLHWHGLLQKETPWFEYGAPPKSSDWEMLG